MVEAMEGRWILQSSENFEELIASFNVGLITRKVAILTVPIMTITAVNVKKHSVHCRNPSD